MTVRQEYEQKLQRKRAREKERMDQAKEVSLVTGTGGVLGFVKGAFPERNQIMGFDLSAVVFAGALAGAIYKGGSMRKTLLHVAAGSGAVAAASYGEALGREMKEEWED